MEEGRPVPHIGLPYEDRRDVLNNIKAEVGGGFLCRGWEGRDCGCWRGDGGNISIVCSVELVVGLPGGGEELGAVPLSLPPRPEGVQQSVHAVLKYKIFIENKK